MNTFLNRPDIKIHLCTSRFNTQTLAENRLGRMRMKKKAVYCNMGLIRNTEKEDYLFIIELNNSENKIAGIAFVENILSENVYRIYSDDNYNQPYYSGNHYKARENMNEKEIEFITKLEITCFYGKKHLKRGNRIMKFPETIIDDYKKKDIDIMQNIKNLFVREPTVP